MVRYCLLFGLISALFFSGCSGSLAGFKRVSAAKVIEKTFPLDSELLSVYPKEGELDVPVDSAIKVYIGKDKNQLNAADSTVFNVYDPAGKTVAGTIAYHQGLVRFTPKDHFLPGQRYMVVIGGFEFHYQNGPIKERAILTGKKSWTFSTVKSKG